MKFLDAIDQIHEEGLTPWLAVAGGAFMILALIQLGV